MRTVGFFGLNEAQTDVYVQLKYKQDLHHPPLHLICGDVILRSESDATFFMF